MGQYYVPINLDTEEWLDAHKYGNGMKLMEHSWIGNNFVNQVICMLTKDGIWHGARIVWAGDYADPENESEDNLYQITEDHMEIRTNYKRLCTAKYIVNETKKEFVDLKKCPLSTWGKVHPLPLLTSEGCGKGGGDYNMDLAGSELVGTWARDSIKVLGRKPKGYKEIVPNFKEY